MDCNLPDSSVPGILQARILEWVDIPFSRASSQPRDQTWVSCTEGRFFNIWATKRAPLAQLVEPKIENFKIEILQARLQQYMNRELPDVQAGFKRQRNQRSNCQHPLDHLWKSKRVPEKHLFLFYWLCQSLWLCGSQSTVENSERDGNTRPPDLPLEKSVCRSGSNS